MTFQTPLSGQVLPVLTRVPMGERAVVVLNMISGGMVCPSITPESPCPATVCCQQLYPRLTTGSELEGIIGWSEKIRGPVGKDSWPGSEKIRGHLSAGLSTNGLVHKHPFASTNEPLWTADETGPDTG